ncbi:tetratricopeptide repeat protein [Ramlibacter sp. XY19]|uniref:tetratricopeptide repeat protein n=1 Tax=Ramlibacter paludis TaxID=2908000 RepID=UPI0023DB1195|nr:tetratricopeptide repeat protein [Ramlibacter paludis]MCG2594735.1 tetratricopeptide repeat protein [Ramlibacter paludis]
MLRGLFDRLSGARGKSAAGASVAPAAAPLPSATNPPTDWKALGNAALGAGQLEEAGRCYSQGVLAQPDDAALRLNLGFVLLQQGKFADAAESLRQSLSLQRPGDGLAHDAWYVLGCAQEGLGRTGEALASFEAALQDRPGSVQALEGAIRAANQLGRPAEAATHAERLAALLPANPGAVFLHYEALTRLGRWPEALTQAERVLALTGPDARALANVAFVLEKLDRLDEALSVVDQALQLDPDNRGALVNRVAVLMELARIPEARAAAQDALRLHPEDANLHWNVSLSHLMLGEFREGWAEHEWRFRSDAVQASVEEFDEPRWRGERLAGRTILVYGEQGFGDNIQFVRYVPELAKLAHSVLLQVPEPLEPLVGALAPNCRLLRAGELMPAFDVHCSLMSLPALMATTLETIPAAVPYLHADPAAVQAWRDRLGSGQLNVGIAWSGNPTQANDRRRSMALATFRALAVDGCRFVTLKPDLRAEDRAALADWPGLVDHGRELRDFADTAALVAALDLVISVDTSAAHLAGALGRPVWILLVHVPDWRWLRDREDSPWYPTARLFRQDATRQWGPVLERVRSELAGLAAR